MPKTVNETQEKQLTQQAINAARSEIAQFAKLYEKYEGKINCGSADHAEPAKQASDGAKAILRNKIYGVLEKNGAGDAYSAQKSQAGDQELLVDKIVRDATAGIKAKASAAHHVGGDEATVCLDPKTRTANNGKAR